MAAVLAAAQLASCASSPPPTPVAAVPGEAWTMYRGDLARDGHPSTATLDATAAARLAFAWRAHLDGAVDGTPAVARGLVIAGSADGEVRAFNATDGQTVWARGKLGSVSASPTVSGDRVYVASLTGFLYAMDLRTGNEIWDWKVPAEGAIWASPVVYRAEVIVGVASPYGDQPWVAGRIYGLDAANGHQLWTLCVQVDCDVGGGVWSTPSIDGGGRAFVGVGNPVDGVLAFDAQTGQKKWLRSLYDDRGRDLDVGASPVIFSLGHDELVGQASVSGLFAVLDAADGAVAWQRQLVDGSAVHGLLATPAYDGTSLYVPSASAPTGIVALQPGDGTIAWRHGTALPIYSAPAVGIGAVVFGTGAVLEGVKDGSILAMSSSDGSVLFTFDTHSAVRSGPAIAGELVVAGDAAGDLFAFRPKS